ncbi:response regulator [Usitatibacter palustris]|uniref:Transcriptional regulatory protein OmpR n=1 Tax=Usitatibacter palustris TaxID=2732487 RepID=A0A6M4H639_9PROT|nr:response regulator [Usitatibacter palustris]QJR15119.1 Transcriptional regulatory protein OmpR [Usitatibacter palustris]
MADVARVLIVEDDEGVREILVEYLTDQGFAVDHADGGEAMRAAIERAMPDVVLLDVNLPGEDGLTLARHLRERYDVGIIMVTGASDVVDRIVGLEVGADDYIAKPFDPRELKARLKSVLRRVQNKSVPTETVAAAPKQGAPVGAARIAMGRCQLDIARRLLLDAEGVEVPLTAMEFDLLRAFADHPNQVLSRDQLLTMTRNREWEPFDRSIDIRIARVRKKLGDESVIRTVRGAGYMYVP